MKVTIVSGETVWGQQYIGIDKNGHVILKDHIHTGKPLFYAITEEYLRSGHGHTRKEAIERCISITRHVISEKLTTTYSGSLDAIKQMKNFEVLVVELDN